MFTRLSWKKLFWPEKFVMVDCINTCFHSVSTVICRLVHHALLIVIKLLITRTTHPFNGPLSRTTRVSRYQQGKTNLDFTEALTHPFNSPLSGTTQVGRYQKGKTNMWETVSSGGISWAICKSAPRSRQTTTPAPHHSVFYRRMPFRPPNQQRQKHWRQYFTEARDSNR